MKHCSRCETNRPRSGFCPRTRSLDGLQPWCKSCFAAYMRQWRKAREVST